MQDQDPKRLAIISNDVVDVRMAGPGVRYLEMARALSADLEVILAVPGQPDQLFPGLQLSGYDEHRASSLRELVAGYDTVLFTPYVLRKFPFLEDSPARKVIDLYDPFIFENLHYYLEEPLELQQALNQQAVELLNLAARAGDFFICGSERQRDLWMGLLLANGRVNPHSFSQDPTLRGLIEVVGVGLPDREPQHKAVLKGVHSAFPPDCKIVLWGGGLWNWMDPLSLVQAWPAVLRSHPEARLVFLGARHPNPLVPRHKIAEQTRRQAAEIGEEGRSIFLFDWMPHQEREALLCEADVGVSLHPAHIEAHYSIRTRVLDYYWARLPCLVSQGDVASEWVALDRLGAVVPAGDVPAIAEALSALLEGSKQDWAPRFDRVRARFAWSQVVEPLRRYCLADRVSPDQKAGRNRQGSRPPSYGWKAVAGRARFIWRNEGFGALLRRAWRFIRWKTS
jgi:glycosyltransferase involved in cell wall biosynthesis